MLTQLLAFNRIDRICQQKPMQKAMDKITLQDVYAFKQARLADVSRTTCRDELIMIKRIFKWYIQEHNAKTGEILQNPCDMLTIPRPSKPRVSTAEQKPAMWRSKCWPLEGA